MTVLSNSWTVNLDDVSRYLEPQLLPELVAAVVSRRPVGVVLGQLDVELQSQFHGFVVESHRRVDVNAGSVQAVLRAQPQRVLHVVAHLPRILSPTRYIQCLE